MAAFNTHTKVDQVLGLDDSATDTMTTVQKNGWLQYLRSGKIMTWKTLFFIVKDGFLLWYNEKSDNACFDTKPKGVLPLSGAVITQNEQDKRVLKCVHSDIPGIKFKLRAKDVGEVMDWIVAMKNGKEATWENVLLGNALIEKMKATGSKLESEKEAAFQALQDKAQKLEKEQAQKAALEFKVSERQKIFESKIRAEKERVEELSARANVVQDRLAEEEAEHKKAVNKRISVERRLKSAEDALRKLEEAMIIREVSLEYVKNFEYEDNEVRASVSTLKLFFEAKAHEQEVLSQATC